jgi:decaprenyl-phosphate phosphoribosyltransferase
MIVDLSDPGKGRATWRGHFAICRVDHWVKNVFVIPGAVTALALDHSAARSWTDLGLRVALGLLATCLVASSNYVLNEVLDAPCDRSHPTKRSRPVPSGLVSVPLAYAQWIGLMLLALGMSFPLSTSFAVTMLTLWVMGCLYNIPPVRTKDLPYVDVLSEAVNNPLRMLAGWFLIAPRAIVPASLLLSYWMVGGYFMAIKRFAELRHIGNRVVALEYRKSFRAYTEERLLVSIMFYASAAMLFLGAFIMRYRIELVLTVPFVSLVMAIYLALAFKDDSAVQAPEKLYRETPLMLAVLFCCAWITLLLFVDLPLISDLFSPTLSPAPWAAPK